MLKLLVVFRCILDKLVSNHMINTFFLYVIELCNNWNLYITKSLSVAFIVAEFLLRHLIVTSFTT